MSADVQGQGATNPSRIVNNKLFGGMQTFVFVWALGILNISLVFQ